VCVCVGVSVSTFMCAHGTCMAHNNPDSPVECGIREILQDGLYVVISGRLRTYTGDQRRLRTLDTRPATATDGSDGGSSSSDDTTDDDSGASTMRNSPGFDSGPVCGLPTSKLALPSSVRTLRSCSAPSSSALGTDAATPRTKRLRFADDARNGVDIAGGGGSPAHEAETAAVTSQRTDVGTPPHRSGARDTKSRGIIRVDVGRGETVGELAVLVRRRRRTTTAICVRDCELVRISQPAFALISSKYPTVVLHFTKVRTARTGIFTIISAKCRQHFACFAGLGQTA
jgi:CRP-like cAMP-binding protein